MFSNSGKYRQIQREERLESEEKRANDIKHEAGWSVPQAETKDCGNNINGTRFFLFFILFFSKQRRTHED